MYNIELLQTNYEGEIIKKYKSTKFDIQSIPDVDLC